MATGRVPTTANSPLTAKGDLFGYSTTQARVAVGNDGETLVADSSATTGLRWQGDYAAGKNKIINGDFGIWQRGTSITMTSNVRTYCADRFTVTSVFSAGSSSVSRQTFTPGTAPVAGYEGQFFQRITAGTTSTYIDNFQFIEDVRTFAGQTITFSFWAKASSAISMNGYRIQNFGSGGSADVAGVQGTFSITTSWQRFTTTFTVPSISGKTVGTSSFLAMGIYIDSGITSGLTIDTWGWQVEAGSVATAFQTATGTIQGELSACQRYFQKSYGQGVAPATAATTSGLVFLNNAAQNVLNTDAYGYIKLPVVMRSAPTVTTYSYTSGTATAASSGNGTDLAANSAATTWVSDDGFNLFNNSGGTINQAGGGFAVHYIASAEL